MDGYCLRVVVGVELNWQFRCKMRRRRFPWGVQGPDESRCRYARSRDAGCSEKWWWANEDGVVCTIPVAASWAAGSAELTGNACCGGRHPMEAPVLRSTLLVRCSTPFAGPGVLMHGRLKRQTPDWAKAGSAMCVWLAVMGSPSIERGASHLQRTLAKLCQRARSPMAVTASSSRASTGNSSREEVVGRSCSPLHRRSPMLCTDVRNFSAHHDLESHQISTMTSSAPLQGWRATRGRRASFGQATPARARLAVPSHSSSRNVRPPPLSDMGNPPLDWPNIAQAEHIPASLPAAR